jgi:hydrogenase/urease accessory protein HupE
MGPAELRRTCSMRTALLILAYLLGAGANAWAHTAGLSSAAVQIGAETIHAELIFAATDIESLLPMDADKDGRLTQAEFAARQDILEELALTSFEVMIDGQKLEPYLESVIFDNVDAIHLKLGFTRQAGTQLSFRSPLLPQLARGHRQHLSVRNTANKIVAEHVLAAGDNTFALAENRRTTLGNFVLLGIEHIVTGYDHLVFLFGLLVVGGSFRAVVKIVTAFTVAHSITLALATFNVLNIPSKIIEPLIAASIVYVGVENIFRKDLERRWLLAFGFGLVHGCGFASVLREMGIGASAGGLAAPLFGFNAGVEIGQLAIASLVLPLIWQMKKRPNYQPVYVPAVSVIIALAGGVWLVQRLLA